MEPQDLEEAAGTPQEAMPLGGDGSGPGPLAVVGIGGSAGALDGYERFFLSLPPGSGLAFVVVPHLDPHARGLMPALLQRCTDLPVVAISDGLRLEADRVYVLPPDSGLSIMNGVLLLEGLGERAGPHQVIDRFFEALAADQGRRAVGVVLSGLGSDGTQGVQAIKAAFGTVLVQDPATAEYPPMPRSAVATQLADSVLPPEELAPHLVTLVTRTRALVGSDLLNQDGQPNVPMQRILRLVRLRTGHDFTQYKRSTLIRRIDRRMKSLRLDDVSAYIRLLQDTPEEVESLFRDLTINVTSFFRDNEAFEEIKGHLRSYLAGLRPEQEVFRVWVAGCATGEEAYSVCIVLQELLEELREVQFFKVQVFATDIDKDALDFARYGTYSADIAYMVSPERLARYFQPKDGGYQVRPEIRDSVIFAVHSTFGDPPFTRLDLLCCRNLLIYLGPPLQRQILSVFHYALNPGALLFLGASETVGTERERFAALSSHWKIYRRLEGLSSPLPPLVRSEGLNLSLPPLVEVGAEVVPRTHREHDLSGQVQRLLLSQYAPPAVVVNAAGELLHVNGRTSRYLELPTGRPLTNILEMVRSELRYELPAALRQAVAEGQEVQRSDLHLNVDGVSSALDLTIRPLTPLRSDLFLVIFEERDDLEDLEPRPARTERMDALESELLHSRELLHATVQQMSVSLEELKSTNEELQTTNEELQSSNEELVTSKEELQSLNEELVTINAEHQRVIHDLAQANDDMKNLLESAGIATVFLGNDLRIKRFTPRITRVINLMPVDVGRPLTDISVNLRYEYLTRDIARVLDTLEPYEAQVQSHDNHWYLMRISPYRTSDNFIDGVVLAFTSINLVKALEAQLLESSEYAEAVLNSMSDPLLVLDEGRTVATANRAFLELMRVTLAQLQDEPLYAICNFAFDQPELLEHIRKVTLTDQPLLSYVIDLPVPPHGARKMKVEVGPITAGEAGRARYLFKLEDVTDLLRRAAVEGEDILGDRPDPE